MRNRNRKGFTLIELLIVIAIIGILAAVLIPNLLAARDRALTASNQACASSIARGQELFAIDNNVYAADYAALQAVADVASSLQCADNAVAEGGNAWTAAGGWTVTHTSGRGTAVVVSVNGIQ